MWGTPQSCWLRAESPTAANSRQSERKLPPEKHRLQRRTCNTNISKVLVWMTSIACPSLRLVSRSGSLFTKRHGGILKSARGPAKAPNFSLIAKEHKIVSPYFIVPCLRCGFFIDELWMTTLRHHHTKTTMSAESNGLAAGTFFGK